MATFTTRVTNENGVIKAWVDQNGSICIEQPHAPGQPDGSMWSSEEEAQAWATEHANLLQTMSDESDARRAREEALLAQAEADSQKIAEIYEMLKSLTQNN